MLVRLFNPLIGARANPVRDLFDHYTSRVSHHSDAAEKERQRNRNDFAEYIGCIPIADLVADDLERWIEQNPSWRSDWTRLRISNTIKTPFNWAVRKGLIDRNPFASVSYRPGERGKPISKADFLRLLREAKAETRRILLFMNVTGIRPGELCALEWSFLDLINGTATLYIHKTRGTRKDRAPRVVILPALAVRVLVWIKRRQQPDEKFVFLNRRGRRLTRGTLDLRIWRLREVIGIPRDVKLYGVRHAWATDLAVGGVDLAPLAALLGHTTLEMAKYYIHLAGRGGFLRRELERGLKEGRKS